MKSPEWYKEQISFRDNRIKNLRGRIQELTDLLRESTNRENDLHKDKKELINEINRKDEALLRLRLETLA